MKSALRILLLIALVAQAWHAIVLTRYERLYQSGQHSFDAWDAGAALSAFDAARDVYGAESGVWRRNGDLALYIHDYPQQVEGQYDPAEMLAHGWEGYAGAILRCPVDSWSWTGIAEIARNRVEFKEAKTGIDLGALDRRRQGILDPERAIALAAARLAVELKPSGFQELDVLASVYDSMGDHEVAARVLAESARMMPVTSYHVWGSGPRLSRPQYDAILEGLREGTQRAPSFERSLLYREIAGFARAQGDYATALEHAVIAEQNAKTPYEVYAANWEMARILEQLGRFEEALEAIQEARSNLDDPGALSRKLGSLEYRLGRVKDACVSLRDAVRRVPDNDALRMQAARACEDAGEFAITKQLYVEAVVDPTDSLVMARAYVQFLLRNGREQAVHHIIRTWKRNFPESDEIKRWSEEGLVGQE